ncbi:LytTR family DNA-binding domain-containing protein [Aureisphaera galaxeae]|uniref:LytR/AlgR family response regulator transcription factor n=1 Tax=Aureisphaera galaxeae TaxID=1538023 RepID=UPI002350DA98|nr:LytTR family DNA-binding domain-containing protein [Aureisphaera galaxeae]MDC8002498.1 LytTR family DNA-binding domain-containing protein [Aureisphaera galaxeae]
MHRIKTIIVDDEKKAREGLVSLLQDDPMIEIAEVCKDGLQAIEFLSNNEVQLVFLDIQMPGIDGFEVLNSIPDSKRPVIIFVTAYDQYALKAFEYHALDYLLKPFTDERFHKALEIAKKNIANNSLEENALKLEKLLKEIRNHTMGAETLHNIVSTPNSFDERIVIKTSNKKIVFVYLKDIEWIEAFDYYIKIHTVSETYLIRESLKRMELKLPKDRFMRVHRSTIVNTQYIKEVVSIGNTEYELTLTNGEIRKVSRSYSAGFSDFVERFDGEWS